jgi:GTP-binding protein
VAADIPGLVEGAHEGHGLGHRFLKHVSRCRVLCHLVDCGGEEGREPVADYETIQRELALYSPKLASRQQVVVATKLDITGADERADALEKYLSEKGIALLRISAVTGDGLNPLLDAVVHEMDAAGPPEPVVFDDGDDDFGTDEPSASADVDDAEEAAEAAEAGEVEEAAE